MWLVVNGAMEGVVLVEVSAAHGLTDVDLTGAAGLALAAYRDTHASPTGRTWVRMAEFRE